MKLRKRRKPSRLFCTVDPGYGGTGWAVFQSDQLQPVGSGVVTETGNTNSDLSNLTGRASRLSQDLVSAVTAHGEIDKAFIEWPRLWAGSGKSFASAASGGLFKLTFLVGQMAHAFLPRTVDLIAPQDWKGQMPKKVVIARIRLALGEGFEPENHEADAIGIGLHVKGAL